MRSPPEDTEDGTKSHTDGDVDDDSSLHETGDRSNSHCCVYVCLCGRGGIRSL